jgi:hypothetical protein
VLLLARLLPRGFSNRRNEAKLPHCSAHGLRKTAAVPFTEFGRRQKRNHDGQRPHRIEGNRALRARRKRWLALTKTKIEQKRPTFLSAPESGGTNPALNN